MAPSMAKNLSMALKTYIAQWLNPNPNFSKKGCTNRVPAGEEGPQCRVEAGIEQGGGFDPRIAQDPVAGQTPPPQKYLVQARVGSYSYITDVQSIEHPNVLREKINFPAHGSANWSFFLCGTLTQYIFRFDKFFAPPTPPTWWYVTKRVILANPKLKVPNT